MTVYARTEEGQLAAYSADSALPRKLRSILKVIDGKTTIEVYVESLRAFGDVRGVLKSLDMAGLIRPMSQLPPGAAKAEQPEQATSASTSFRQTQQQSAPSSVRGFFKRPGKGPTDSDTQFAATRQELPSAVSRTSPSASQEQSLALGRAVDAMSNFILTYAPEHSFMVLKELEMLSNLEQLAVTLGGYEQLVQHLGAPAQEHLSSIKTLLREYL
jgi:hypothetical protein